MQSWALLELWNVILKIMYYHFGVTQELKSFKWFVIERNTAHLVLSHICSGSYTISSDIQIGFHHVMQQQWPQQNQRLWCTTLREAHAVQIYPIRSVSSWTPEIRSVQDPDQKWNKLTTFPSVPELCRWIMAGDWEAWKYHKDLPSQSQRRLRPPDGAKVNKIVALTLV